MRPASGLTMLDIPANIMGRQSVIHPTLIWDEETVILVDTGFPGLISQLRQTIEDAGVPFEKLNLVILTHHDIDHIGGLKDIRGQLPGAIKVFAYQEEKAYIEGEKRPLKLAKLEANLGTLPDEMKATYQKMKAAFENSQSPVDETLNDGEELPYCGGIIVIHTPGHTLGHISLYLKNYKTLIAGDILHVNNGELVIAPSSANYDTAMSRQSLKKLSQYDIDTVICYHGGLYQDETSSKIAALAKDESVSAKGNAR